MVSISDLSMMNDIKKAISYNMQLIVEAIHLLEATGSLPAKYRPHKLSGKLQGIWECHIEPDWLMTWNQNDIPSEQIRRDIRKG